MNKVNSIIKEKSRNIELNSEIISKKIIKKNDGKNIKNLKEKGDKNNFWNYILYKITFKQKKNNPFKVYEKFRMKIISEEHLIRNHLNIYNLLKITEKKRLRRTSTYHFSDLINLV